MVKTKNYQNGKIYQVVDKSYQLCYIGSTIDKLNQRFNSHKSKYKRYNNGIQGFTTVYNIFDEYGVENCKIELLEYYPCITKEDLTAREGHYIKNTQCVNKTIMGRTNKEYRQDNKDRINAKYNEWKNNNQEHLKEYKATHYQENKDHYSQKGKEWRENNKEKKKETDKAYREKNKEIIKQKEKELINCQCGSTIQRTEKARHEKSQKHQDWLKQQEEE